MNPAVTSRQRQRDQTRTRILEAAVAEFARSGFEAASLSAIAAAAGVKKALVQYHFATKDQLWRDAADQLWSARNQHLAAAVALWRESDDEVAMRNGFTALVEFTREHPQWLWFMFHEAAAEGERMHWLLEHHIRDDYLLGEDFIRRCQRRGLIRQGSPVHLLHLISGALTYNLLVAPQTRQASGVDLASEDSIAQQVALLASVLAP